MVVLGTRGSVVALYACAVGFLERHMGQETAGAFLARLNHLCLVEADEVWLSGLGLLITRQHLTCAELPYMPPHFASCICQPHGLHRYSAGSSSPF